MIEESRQPPVPPADDALPKRRTSRFRSGNDAEFSVALKVVTPILGGGFFTAGEDKDYRQYNTIRVPSIRGHLRFWWRALQPVDLTPTGQQLRQRERDLWGGMGTAGGNEEDKQPKASRVSVRVEAVQPENPEIDSGDPPDGGRGYSLFPAREQTRGVIRPTVPRLKPGITFTLRVSCPADHVEEVRRAVQAWILFGGYGSRTRRGLGSLTVTADTEQWLPNAPGGDMVQSLIAGTGSTTDTPTVAGSWLVFGQPIPDAEKAWDRAVEQLQLFRQQPGLARDAGQKPNHPGQSRWPEPDKIRHLTNTWGHPQRPEIGPQPAWPRAQFGLPIVGRFNAGNEPGAFDIQWQADGANKPCDRLASPLIVKALPLADGKFVPCALWLARGFPAGKAVLVMNKHVVSGSAAPFERMRGDGDTDLHDALKDKSSVRQAFLDWLVKDCRWQRVNG